MPVIFERDLDFIFGLNRERTGYSLFCRCENTRRIDESFGLYSGHLRGIKVLAVDGEYRFADNRPQPAGEEAKRTLDQMLFVPPRAHESFKVILYFIETAKRLGFFPGLPYHEIPQTSQERVNQWDLNQAVEEGYLARYSLLPEDVRGVEIVEPTIKFRPFLSASEELAV